MTTRVKILNEGPDTVKVEVQGRDQGRFIAVAELDLEVGKFADFYLHDDQSLQVLEAKKEAE